MGLEAVFLLEGEDVVPMGLEAVFLLEVVPMGLEAVLLLEGELNSIALVALVVFNEVVVEAAVKDIESIEWDRESL